MQTETITILAGRAVEALKMLKKFQRKAERYGVPFRFSFGETYMQERREQTDNMWYHEGVRRYKVAVVDVTIEGEKPVVGDYEFVASIEITAHGNFVDCAPGQEADIAWRTTDQRCEHCGTERRRKHIYIVRDRSSGKMVQVGRTCLRDFLGIDDPKWIVQRFKFFRQLRDEDGLGGFGSWKWSECIDFLLAATLACTRIWGWTSKGQARDNEDLTPTVDRIWTLYSTAKADDEERLRIREEIREEDRATAAQIMEWVRGSDDSSDYMHNLRVAFGDDVVEDQRRVGLVISAVASWHRAQERELKRARELAEDRQSQHVGEERERLRDIPARLEMRRGIGDDGFGGYREIVKFRDADGNIFTWFTARCPALDIGEDVLLTGTVKRHSEFNGIKETQLNRVTFKEAA